MNEQLSASSDWDDPILIAGDTTDGELTQSLKGAKVLNPIITVSTASEVIDYLSATGAFRNSAEHPFPALLLLNIAKEGEQAVLSYLKAENEDLPIVVVSADDDCGGIAAAYKLGARSFLTKPTCPKELLDAIEGTMDLRLSFEGGGVVVRRIKPISYDEADSQLKKLHEAIHQIEEVIECMRKVAKKLEARHLEVH